MNRDQSRYWGTYARELANKLELRDWTITVERSYAPDSFAGTAHCVYGRKAIDIELCLGFDEMAPEKQRQILTHELIHAHTARTFQVLRDARENIGKDWVSLLESTVRQDLEYAIDALADAVSRGLPLPPTEPKQPKRAKKQRKATA